MDFEFTRYVEIQKAQKTLAELLGSSYTLKPLPESGGTIYFNAKGTNQEDESFKLVLNLEKERMAQMMNMLYGDLYGEQ